MNTATVPLTSAAPAEASPPNSVLLLAAMAMAFVGMLGCALALVLGRPAFGSDRLQLFGAFSLVLVFVGLLAGCAIRWRWQRDAAAQRAAALRLSRFHAVMSQTNRLMLRRPNPFELFEGVCEICVEAGEMDFAVVDMSDVREVHREASEGLKALSGTASLLLEGAQLQTLMMTRVLRAGERIIVDDASTDERLSEARAWCVHTGVCSLAALPLRRGGALVGIVLLCSRTKAFFGGAVEPLLSELGADLSFALDNADRELERHSALMADHARRVAEDASRAKTEFLAQMSHELRTPLNAILGFAQLLATDQAQLLSKGQAERVRLITHAGWHLLGLVDDVMDISRIESRRLQVINVCCNISSVLAEAMALTQPLARARDVELFEQTASGSGTAAVVDPRRLLQVLLNLLSNACKYNRPGGRVRVDVIRSGAEVILDVVDNGIGMTGEQLSHLFEPFNRLGNEGRAVEGSGIGLMLTRQLVEMMNGRLEIESHPASGTRARLVLPSCDMPVESSADETLQSSTAGEAQDAAVILYIEDDPVNRILVEQMLLRCEGVQLLQAENGEHGIALAREVSPDLVLLDMHLPDMTGVDVLESLRADPRTEALRVVSVSANAMAGDIAKAMELGVLDYWTKPLKLEAFLAGIAAILSLSVPGTRVLRPAHADA